MARYSGKYRRKKRTMPLASWVLILMAVLSLSTGAVVAYLSTSAGDVTNTFEAETSLDPTIFETFETENTDYTYYNEKHNVVVNVKDLDYAVYVRAAVLVNWKNGANGNVLAQAPVKDVDYTIHMGDSGWFEHGGFYYYSKMISGAGVENKTANLINSITVKETAPVSGYTLNVEIITQTIQALGTTDADNTPAVTSAWGIEIDGAKKLIDPTP